jgi:hypothetical protein
MEQIMGEMFTRLLAVMKGERKQMKYSQEGWKLRQKQTEVKC